MSRCKPPADRPPTAIRPILTPVCTRAHLSTPICSHLAPTHNRPTPDERQARADSAPAPLPPRPRGAPPPQRVASKFGTRHSAVAPPPRPAGPGPSASRLDVRGGARSWRAADYPGGASYLPSGALVHNHTGTQPHWHPTTRAHNHTGTQPHGHTTTLAHNLTTTITT